MKDEIVNKGVDESGESFVKDHGFAAVPIHFKPGEGAEKKIALVIPGIEPPLAFFRVTGESPDSLTFEEIDGHVESVSQSASGEDVKEDTTPLEAEEQNNESDDSSPPEEEEQTDDDSEPSGEEDDISYPFEDDGGNPVAGFLIGNEDNQPLVILVKPQDGESTDEAMARVSNDHPEHIPGSLEEATKALGHSPLSSEK